MNAARRLAGGALLASALATLVSMPVPVQAQAAWPERPLRIITAAAPGSGLDILTRTLARQLQQRLQQPVIVENKPGANQIIAADACAKSAPDGYTFCTTAVEPYTSNAFLFRKLPYDPDGFTPVAMLTTLIAGIVARTDLGARTLAEIVALSKQQPGRLNWGSYGPGSNSHLYLEAVRTQFGWDVTHVPYKSTIDATQAIVARDVHLVYMQIGQPLRKHIDDGELRLIAYAGERRSPSWPDVPTFAEVGLGDYLIRGWWGMVAPGGTPAPIVQKMNDLAQAIVNAPESRELLKSLSVEPYAPNSPADMAANIRANREVVRAALTRAGVQAN
ncbi:MAG TPA: tripartite tricarboxylate transporter substrate binding protein [Burkholderiaceae bacterium]|nr:tripartite tricarboxylate transporter substrate binding protein [Burkholderiaceae bacterium]